MNDKCGPQGNSVFQKFFSAIVPDVIFGVDVSECCQNHDLNWDKKGANKSGDKAFRDEIEDKFYIAGKPRWLGFLVAHWYYIGVRFGGIFYKLGV